MLGGRSRADHRERALEGVGGEPAGLVDALTQPGDHHVARELLEAALLVRLGDEQRRVEFVPWSTAATRPGRSSWIGSTVSATHAPTTSSPPARWLA